MRDYLSLLRLAVMVAVIALVFMLLAACTAQPVKPQVLKVPVTVYVPIPDALTSPCPIASPQNYTVPEAVRVARERRASLEKCNAQLQSIRGIQGSKQ